jgi:hypothetical protein
MWPIAGALRAITAYTQVRPSSSSLVPISACHIPYCCVLCVAGEFLRRHSSKWRLTDLGRQQAEAAGRHGDTDIHMHGYTQRRRKHA